jgi:hypothetical protein
LAVDPVHESTTKKPARARTGERFKSLAKRKCRKHRGSALIGLQGCPIDADPCRWRDRGREAAGAWSKEL